MTGLLLLLVALAWLTVSTLLTGWIVKRIRPSLKAPAALLVFSILMILPVLDEVVGGHQFRAMCELDGRKEADFARAKGRTLQAKIKEGPPVSGTILEIRSIEQVYSDLETNAPVISFKGYEAKGGWFIRVLGISETNSPLTFESSCGGFGEESLQGWLDRYQIKLIFN